MLSFPVLFGLATRFVLSTQVLWIIFIFVLLLLMVLTVFYVIHNRRRIREQENEQERLRIALEQTKKREKAAEDKLFEAKSRQEQAARELAEAKEQLLHKSDDDTITDLAEAPVMEELAEKNRAYLAATSFLVGSDFELVSVIDLKADSFEVFGADNPGELTAGEISYSDASRSFAMDSCVPEDREKVLWQTSLQGLREQLKGRESFELTTDVTEEGRPRRKIMRFTRFNGSEDLLLATRRDVTELMEREARQKSALAAALLEAESAGEKKSDFLSSISRSVKTSISDVLILSASAEEEAADDKTKDAFRSIRRSSSAAVSMLSDVLDVLELESGKLSPDVSQVDVPDFMADVKTRAQRAAAERKLSYVLKTGGAAPKRLSFDKQRAERIIDTLLDNAIKFSSGGSEISHTVTYSAPANGRVYIRHVIADSGCGMSSDFLPKAVQPFTKERPETEGSGLGLYIASHLAEALDGSLDIDSAEGTGTTVILTLPAKQ